VISLPVSIQADFDVRRLDQSSDKPTYGAATRVASVPRGDTRLKDSAEFAIIFQTGIMPPAGAAIFKISNTAENDALRPSTEAVYVERRELVDPTLTDNPDAPIEVSNGLFTVKFDR
jgi:hypothetical protein